jgi:hypothetical protein
MAGLPPVGSSGPPPAAVPAPAGLALGGEAAGASSAGASAPQRVPDPPAAVLRWRRVLRLLLRWRVLQRRWAYLGQRLQEALPCTLRRRLVLCWPNDRGAPSG